MRLRMLLLALLYAGLGGCRGAPNAAPDAQPRPAGVPPQAARSPWADVHFACQEWAERIGNDSRERWRGPAVVSGDPPELRELSHLSGRHAELHGWSADGRWLALMMTGLSGERALVALGGPHGEPRPLAPEAKLWAHRQPYSFRWSPTDSQFALIDSVSHVFLGDAAEGTAREVGLARYAERGMPSDLGERGVPAPAWSPDGALVAWPGDGRQWCVLRSLPGEKAAVVEVSAERLLWAPRDHRAVAYAAPEDGASETPYVLLNCGSEPIEGPSIDGPVARGGDHARAARWSPDGRLLAMATGSSFPWRGLRLVDSTGATVREAVVEPGFWHFRWLGDGSGVICARKDAGLWCVGANRGADREASEAVAGFRDLASDALMACHTAEGRPAVFDLQTGNTVEFTGAAPTDDQISPGEIGALDPRCRWALFVRSCYGDRVPWPGRVARRSVEGHSEVHLCDVATGRAERVLLDIEGTGEQPPYLMAVARHWQVSPDGRFVVFHYDYPPRACGWGVLDVATGRVTDILRSSEGPRQWLPGPPGRAGGSERQSGLLRVG